MSKETVHLQIPFQVLMDAIASLGLEEKRQLWQLLNAEITPSEGDNCSRNYTSQNNTNVSHTKSEEILTFEEMVSRYPDRWLLIGKPEVDENQNIIRGQVLAYSSDEQEIYNSLSLFDVKSKAIEYTGTIPEDLAVLM